MKKHFFKVWYGYDKSFQIDEDELARALYAHMTGKKVFLKNFSLNGNLIGLIEPDYHRAMGFNDEYKLRGEDFALIRGKYPDYDGLIGKTKDSLVLMIKEGRTDLIGAAEQKLLG